MQKIAVGSPFWYRRLSETSLLVGILLLSVFGIEAASGGMSEIPRMPATVAAAAAITTLIGALATWFTRRRQYLFWGLFAYIALFSTVGFLVFATGGALSPYAVLWMLLVVLFSGIFGLTGVLTLAVPTNGLIAWQTIYPPVNLTMEHLVIFALATNLPLAIGYIIWHKGKQQSQHATTQMNALTKELSVVANKAETVINSIADGVITVDTQGTIQLINPAAQALVGWGGADAVGLNYDSVFKLIDKHEQPLSAGQNPIEQVKVTKQPIINNELTLISKSGKKMIVSLVVSPILEGKTVVAVIVVARDITSEKAHEREQAEFISTASHEMRTPVASIEGYLGLAMNPQTANIDDKARLYLSKAQEAVKHLGRLFQDLLTVSRAEDGRLQNHPQPTDAVAFVGSITEGLLPKAAEKGLELRFNPYYDKPNDGEHKLTPIFYVNTDRDHLNEVTSNLIENAIKYTKEGKIIVDVTGNDRSVTISVKDSGIGIPNEDIPHLFQKFYRVDNSDTREIGGTGLGLYISRRLVESMRGRIWVESEFGKGSTFFTSFPRVSNLEIKNIQQSEAIEALQKTAEASPVPAPAAPVTSLDIVAPAVPPVSQATPMTQSTPPPIQPVPTPPRPQAQKTTSAPLPAAPAEVSHLVADIRPGASSSAGSGRRGAISIPNRQRGL